jgi:hypothetical protein
MCILGFISGYLTYYNYKILSLLSLSSSTSRNDLKYKEYLYICVFLNFHVYLFK